MTYHQALEYLNSFIDYEKLSSYAYNKAFGLDRIRKILEVLGNPHHSLRIIHVAGTKGKGSTCAMVASVLAEAGYKAGLYTSPHLEDFRERIKINGCMIEKEDVVHLTEKIKSSLEKLEKNSNFEKPTFFEVYTALAFLYFKEKKVDFAVLEVGLGGRLDATNVAQPLASAITSLSLEHMDKLGSTIEDIAVEKAGIIKKASVVITAPQEKKALDVIKAACMQHNARLYQVGKDISFGNTRSDRNQQIFDIAEYKDLRLNLLGRHQIINAAVAVGIINALKQAGFDIPERAVREGLIKTDWPGRLEIINKEPLIVLDGAQNPASAKALCVAIKEFFKFQKLILVLGISSDKDIEGICKEFVQIADRIIITRVRNPRAEPPEAIERAVKKTKKRQIPLDLTLSSVDALDKALEYAGEKDLILVSGSLYLVGEAKGFFNRHGCVKRYDSCHINAAG